MFHQDLNTRGYTDKPRVPPGLLPRTLQISVAFLTTEPREWRRRLETRPPYRWKRLSIYVSHLKSEPEGELLPGCCTSITGPNSFPKSDFLSPRARELIVGGFVELYSRGTRNNRVVCKTEKQTMFDHTWNKL